MKSVGLSPHYVITQLLSVADDQRGPVVLGLVGGSKQSAHADPPHHVPTKRPRETGRHASGEMVCLHTYTKIVNIKHVYLLGCTVSLFFCNFSHRFIFQKSFDGRKLKPIHTGVDFSFSLGPNSLVE